LSCARTSIEIRAKEGTSAFKVTKLLKLIGELNDNYARGNTYASHALLRGLLDHIPPILGQPHFDAVVSSYRWKKTDKKYMQQLAAFRAQGDDAQHRQISGDPISWASTTCRRASAWTSCCWSAPRSCSANQAGDAHQMMESARCSCPAPTAGYELHSRECIRLAPCR
jgi:hypothetical protein